MPWNSRDRLSELLPLPRVSRPHGRRRRVQAQHLPADADPPLVQGLDRDLVAFPTSPRTFAAGTRQLSRISSQVEEARMPSLSSFWPT